MTSASSPSSDLHAEGSAHYRAGRLHDARRAFEAALTGARASGNLAAEAEAANNLGVVFQKLKRRAEAHQQFETSVALFVQVGDAPRRAQALGNLGTLLADMRKFKEAEARLAQSAEIFHQQGDRPSEALTLKWLSRTHMQHLDFFGAISAYERALARLEPLPAGQRLLRAFLQIPLRLLAHGPLG
ncbi:MAG: tetratricopeptide repeat protein [Chloroflexi bacterium]|nr:tetratricopeptide repeat protein [Chloroflexota bacterium]